MLVIWRAVDLLDFQRWSAWRWWDRLELWRWSSSRSHSLRSDDLTAPPNIYFSPFLRIRFATQCIMSCLKKQNVDCDIEEKSDLWLMHFWLGVLKLFYAQCKCHPCPPVVKRMLLSFIVTWIVKIRLVLSMITKQGYHRCVKASDMLVVVLCTRWEGHEVIVYRPCKVMLAPALVLPRWEGMKTYGVLGLLGLVLHGVAGSLSAGTSTCVGVLGNLCFCCQQ